jgi:hypothetical protein
MIASRNKTLTAYWWYFEDGEKDFPETAENGGRFFFLI